MKPIPKFRAWDLKNKKMCLVWAIHWKTWDDGDALNFVEVEGDDGTYELMEHEVILLQYTDLKDKNGKEIYVGDIIKWNNLEILELQYYDSAFRFMTGIMEYDCIGDYLTCKYAEVIGNLYENNDLL